MMTAQEIFDTVARHLIAQGKQAVDESGYCKYRAPDGRRCAAGVLITDEEYVPNMEGVMFGDSQVAWPPRLLVHEKLVRDLQSAHDQCEDWRAIRAKLALVAARHSLSAEVLR